MAPPTATGQLDEDRATCRRFGPRRLSPKRPRLPLIRTRLDSEKARIRLSPLVGLAVIGRAETFRRQEA